MKTLLINAHPDFENHSHFSNQLQDLFEKKFFENFSEQDLTVLNLYETDIPRIEEGNLLTLWNKQATKEPLTEQEIALAKQSETLLTQLKAHHRLVLVSPLHNFNVTSRMKNYIDNLMIARETFRYLDTPLSNGKVSVGLMTNDYRALLLFASGSIYTNNDFYRHLDFAPQYLKTIFSEIMGYNSFDIVRAEGTAFLSAQEILERASYDLDVTFKRLYDK
ncbi:FMN-dependent NADH-azoreductase [Lactococcus allomyrinae]|uniref:FMN dependent NADH:quinone oxidoreductase n=1 Tax=Lactococcus allomyrinae TaxID=2419773 RepID=A0A387BD97_9LACT|nr:NAD(P)H-dependent oxidoreductase [Lactococcus allomyrinae]AYG01823.1 FMN-dependent NADH-azoreductase [Lactococcus allomyrinae]